MAAALQHREAELRHQMEVTRTITENMTSGLFMVDRNGCPTFMNPAAERLTGFRLEEIERSEEHTSELQSLMRISYAVFCLKKKKRRAPNKAITIHNTST